MFAGNTFGGFDPLNHRKNARRNANKKKTFNNWITFINTQWIVSSKTIKIENSLRQIVDVQVKGLADCHLIDRILISQLLLLALDRSRRCFEQNVQSPAAIADEHVLF